MKPYLFTWKMPADVRAIVDRLRGFETRAGWLSRVVRAQIETASQPKKVKAK